MRKQIVYMAGSGHSGSTLLGMMLGKHPEISDLGEANRLYISARAKKSIKPHLCGCGKSVKECYFWLKVTRELQKMYPSNSPFRLENFITCDPKNLTCLSEDDEEYLSRNVVPNNYMPRVNHIAMVVGSKQVLRLLTLLSKDVRANRLL